MFDQILDRCRTPGLDEAAEQLIAILRRNAGLRHDALLPKLGPEALMALGSALGAEGEM